MTLCFTLTGDSCVKYNIKDGVAVVKFDTPDSKVVLVYYIISKNAIKLIRGSPLVLVYYIISKYEM